MKLLFLVMSLALGLALGSPAADVEIVKQRLVKFPEETFQYQTSEQSDETRRILGEINKINVALGYVKKEEERKVDRGPTYLDSDTYLYPRPAYHPIHSNYNNGVALPATIRNYDQEHGPIARKIIHHHSIMIPQPFSAQAYYYPEPYLRAPFKDSPRLFRPISSDIDNFGSNILAISNDITSIVEYARDFENNNENKDEEYKNKVLSNVKQIVDEVQEKKPKASKVQSSQHGQEKKNQFTPPKFLAVPAQLHQLPGIIVARKPNPTEFGNIPRPMQQSNPVAQNSTNQPQLRGPFNFLIKPLPHFFKQQVPVTTVPPPSQDLDNDNDDDYDDQETYLDSYQDPQKGIFSQALDTQKEVFKSGGVLIQKLRVRKGGIAIAGPGGVATAGSGGTAIIGPGGLALTHPRSLTIAGPGAKIYALPESYDLEKAVLGASARSLPSGGVLVATGPTIYYSP